MYKIDIVIKHTSKKCNTCDYQSYAWLMQFMPKSTIDNINEI